MPADNFISSFEQSQDEFIAEVEKLEEDGLSVEEILAILAATNMAAYFLEDLGMSAAINTLDTDILKILDDLPSFGVITETQLQAFRNIANSSVLSYTNSLGDDLRNIMAQGITNGSSKDDIRNLMRRVTKGKRVEVVINEALRAFEQSVIAEMSRTLPDNVLFSYVGPLDEKTRPLCRHILARSPLTRKQIDSLFPGAFLDRGGFNCRHLWLPNEPTNKKLRQIARESIQGKTRPQTLKEYYENS